MEGSFKEKTKCAPVKVDCLVAPSSSSVINKGVRKSDKSDKKSKSFRGSVGRHGTKDNVNRDDFLKATMRIFLVVSPPVGKMQVN